MVCKNESRYHSDSIVFDIVFIGNTSIGHTTSDNDLKCILVHLCSVYERGH